MTWDTKDPSKPTKPSASQPQGWDGPGWWDETGVPTRKTATTVRSGSVGQPSLGQPIRGTSPAIPASYGAGNGNGTNGSANGGVASARRTKSRSRSGSKARTDSSLASIRVVAGFAVGAIGFLFLTGFIVLGVSQAYDGKIMPGVHAGSVDLSGMTRADAVSAIDTAYASLGQGKVTITTPNGTGTISYKDAGRGPDAAAMADAALAVGHGDNPVASVATTLRTFAGGVDIPVIVKLDPLALEMKLHAITGTSQDPPKDADVSTSGSNYTVVPGTTGRGIDEATIATGLIDYLAKSTAPAEIIVGGKFVTVQPNVSDKDAQAAIDSANKMTVPVTLTYSTKTWTIDAATIRSWLLFGVRTDGTFGPVVNPALVKTYVQTLSNSVTVKPVEPKVIYTNGTPSGLTAGTAGSQLDVDGTSQAVETYLDALGSGGATSGTSVALVVSDVQPTITDPTLAGFVIIGYKNVTFFPGESNGFGANIEIPSRLLNGLVIEPAEHFSFLRAMGPIDAAHGFRLGGVIKNGVSNHTGAMGGGICSASTTTFQAAANAGLQIDERHAHYYWITRYAPFGMDATVYSNGFTTWDMRFTNDTPNPIVIKSFITGSSTQKTIHVQLWSLPTGRKVTYTKPVVTDVVKASDGTQYVPSLPAGQKTYRKEYPTNGLNATISRTVADKTGAVIHYDTWSSHYTKVDGLLQIAGTPQPSHTPAPKTPAPTPAITPPAATPTAVGPRRRLLRV
jgi:vancomycin resistance protein YoaR